ncbi:rod shape-determining protein MreD [Mergibacter septicus]|uniref:rod shape-determining protein MreD n=1 Tax=Mergibacter septicus TaxID=221402 RepID=UPI001C759F01|nr:rod shape-determining protein MreD [Mergibacter septicus]QDJ13797.1 rod shape-determining protein MreD [Mergibacter septicus]
MKIHSLFQCFVVFLTFLLALVCEVFPWPVELQGYRPAWLIMVLMYWVMAIPNKVNIGTAFLLGLSWDLVSGSLLGLHALILSVFVYLLATHNNYLILRNLSLWQQSLLVILFIAVIRFGLFLVELFVHNAKFHSQELIGSIVSGSVWPWVFLILRGIRRKISLR